MSADLHPLLAASLLLLLAFGVEGDLREHRIPNWLSLGGIGMGITLQLALRGASGAGDAVQGALAGGLILLPLWLLRGMAAGDVKLMAAAGAHLEPRVAVLAALATLLVGALIALGVHLRRRASAWRTAGDGTFAYAPAIAGGTVLAVALPLLQRTLTG